ncbi:hypothetical protein ACERIT_05950 [Halopenitus sp. H-Gu1]|uniref:hypothetical protein n=1 Tax=Halopenitus sp. H-Gu1 TaxID=3242697 RepID=UPI00359DE6F4
MTRLWLVDREFDSKGLVRLTYATTDGERVHTRELAEQRLSMGDGVTAAIDVEETGEEEVLAAADEEDRERFRTEAQRMAADHDPDETV